MLRTSCAKFWIVYCFVDSADSCRQSAIVPPCWYLVVVILVVVGTAAVCYVSDGRTCCLMVYDHSDDIHISNHNTAIQYYHCTRSLSVHSLWRTYCIWWQCQKAAVTCFHAEFKCSKFFIVISQHERIFKNTLKMIGGVHLHLIWVTLSNENSISFLSMIFGTKSTGTCRRSW
jgi:hypothetical protein